ncbi:organic cation transporter 1-like isoform X1 [Vespa mandarinia]|uniref:organic cation transporter 1-like isoform X1 n=1 Tax=Vespa mandarinia TaxID=7446 RepID=UPI0016143E67|nr:organic cation transporter 1-like isoform X1 [Vespa mandarinia]XP_035734251.1 organic cation transporter 1-like isoform X1 [Vespa mandarinia]XP_035734252.1 organic cation transporter 1-like isoform X1 [Vespa mandarinia]XP_035734253.1 organic cation transporter 1-like isoform X1 [Vespa mandarinia]XP_035734254.1 organic cation transporter 1-like isoform X1 [Vespa mandarinia]XP_035734255.1 organic cation transporter 1-like isoform X1 [Vespa mandarinia]XP_035734256.1 organic cation transporter
MSSIDFDEVLLHVGEKGRYQNIMYYLLCIPATLPAAFLAFSQVFVSASPEHWCKIPELENLTGLMTLEEKKALSLPYSMKSDGRRVYSKCQMYDVNYTEIIESWLRRGISQNSSNTMDSHSTTSPSSTSSFHPTNRLPPPPVSDPYWPVNKCQHGWIYDNKDYDSTLVTELDLVCDNSWWPSTSTTFFYVGSLFGNVVFGWIADKWGRRTAFFAILFLEVIFSIATSFSPNYVIYTALRTVNGLFFPAIYQIPFILALELMGPRYRTFAGMVICMFFASAMCLLALLGYLLRHWYTLSLATSVPFVLLFSYYWIIPESPRWLLSKNRIDEAEVIVQHMAKVNGRTVPSNFLRQMEVEIMKRQGISCNGKNTENVLDIEAENRSPPPSATPMDLIRNPNIRKKFFILAFDWVANAVVYNGLSYNTTNLGVSDYLAFFIGGIVEIPSYVITWYAMDRLGRRWVLCLTMLLGGVACVSCMFVPEVDAVWVTVCLAMIGKFGIAASFAVFYVFVGELLPTVLRSQAMGIASFIAGIGLLTFPYIVHLAVYSRVLPLIIMGSLSVAGALTSVFLPETLNIHLPQTIEEGELFGADFKLWSCPIIPKKDAKRKSESMPLKYLVNGKPERISAATKMVETEKESQEAELTKPIKDDIEKDKDDIERISESSNEEIDRLRKIQ